MKKIEKTGLASVDKPWLEKIKYDNEMPNVNMTAYDYLYEVNINNLNDVALIYDALIDMEPTRITYKKLFKLIDECSKSYTKLGIKKGDIVTVSLPSCIENILCKTRFRKHVVPVEYIVVDNIPKTSAGKDDYRYVENFDSGNAEQVKMKVLYRKEVK